MGGKLIEVNPSFSSLCPIRLCPGEACRFLGPLPSPGVRKVVQLLFLFPLVGDRLGRLRPHGPQVLHGHGPNHAG